MAASFSTPSVDVSHSIAAFAVEIRHASHRDPRLSGQEHDTTARLIESVAQFGTLFAHIMRPIDVVSGIGGSGALLVIRPSGSIASSPCGSPTNAAAPSKLAEELRGRHLVLFRAELDGLPIPEDGEEAVRCVKAGHRSKVPGVSMKCGHDGHHAAMIATLLTLACCPQAAAAEDDGERPAAFGLLLQPAEETGEGARAVVADPAWREALATAASVTPLAFHNVPGLPLAQMSTRVGVFAKASTGFVAEFTGMEAHAGEPHNGISPVVACSNAALRLTREIGGAVPAEQAALSTLTHLAVGLPTFGVAPGGGRLHVTMRANHWEGGVAVLVERAKTIVAEEVERFNAENLAAAVDGDGAAANGRRLTFTTRICEDFTETTNDADTVAAFEAAAADIGLTSKPLSKPMSWSEDFGVLTSFCGRGAMVALGCGSEHPALHTLAYDFPDALLQPATKLFSRAAVGIATGSSNRKATQQ